MPKKSTIKKFIKKAEEVHNFWYDYSKSVYINSSIKIEIICSIHGSFWQIPNNHLRGAICKKCSDAHKGKKRRLLVQDFIKRSSQVHNNKYDYSLVEYINNKTNVKIICPIHGIFEQQPDNHLQGCDCLECGGKKKSNTKEFIKKAKKVHDNKYNYSLVNYINDSTKVKIICPIHGIFKQIPNSHLQDHGCPLCKQVDTSFNFIKFYKRSLLGQETGIFYKLLFTHIESGVQFIKVGITRNTVKERYRYKYDDFQYKIINQIKDTNLNCALMEKLYIKENKENKFQLPETWEFDGRTECFNFDEEKLKFKEVRL